jgi:hypothetical protein
MSIPRVRLIVVLATLLVVLSACGSAGVQPQLQPQATLPIKIISVNLTAEGFELRDADGVTVELLAFDTPYRDAKLRLTEVLGQRSGEGGDGSVSAVWGGSENDPDGDIAIYKNISDSRETGFTASICGSRFVAVTLTANDVLVVGDPYEPVRSMPGAKTVDGGFVAQQSRTVFETENGSGLVVSNDLEDITVIDCISGPLIGLPM